MSTMKELDMCPACMKKLQEQIQKAQQEFYVFQENEMKKMRNESCEKKEKAPEESNQEKACHYGALEKATPEEIDNCLASLNYALPICDICKTHKNISIIKLPPSAITIEKVEDSQKST